MKKISLMASAVALMALTFASCGQPKNSDNEEAETQEEAVIEDVTIVEPLDSATQATESCCQEGCDDCEKAECGKADDCKKAEDCKTEASAATAAATKGIVDLADDAAIRPDMKVKALTILDFNATWCVPCKKLTPAFHKAAEKFAGKVNFYNIDIDKNPKTASAFKVESVPTVVFITPSGKVQSYVGLGPFVGESGATDAENIYNNLAAMIEKAL